MSDHMTAEQLRGVIESVAAFMDSNAKTNSDDLPATEFDRDMKLAAAHLREAVARLTGMAAVVPEGYKLVPLTPTLEMQRAYFNSIDKHMDRVQTSPCFGRHENQRIAYAQMLAAAPEPPHV